MGFFDIFKNKKNSDAISEKSYKSETNISLLNYDNSLFPLLGNDFRYGTRASDFLKNAYGNNPYVYMVIDRIVSRLMDCKKELVLKSNNEIEVIDANLINILSKPNSKESYEELVYRIASTFLACGEAFVFLKDDEYICPVNYNVIINEDLNGNIYSYNITYFGDSFILLPYEVLHIKSPDISYDTNHGNSPLRAGRKVWESNNEVWATEAALHKNKGISGILHSKGNRVMTNIEKESLQKKYDLDNSGASNFGKVKVSNEELGYIPMGMNATDLKSIETRVEHLRTVCAIYKVDSKLFGDSQASTFNNVHEASVSMILNAVIPLGQKILPRLVEWIGSTINLFDVTVIIKKESFLELSKPNYELSNKVINEVNAGIITAEEAKEILYPNKND